MRLIFIPCHNDTHTLPAVLERVNQFTNDDVLVVDDGSDVPVGKIPGVTVVRHPQQRGYGGAMMTGFQYAIDCQYDTVITLDADLQHDAGELPAFFEAAELYDVASGTRYHDLSKVVGVPPPDRRHINMQITHCLRSITGYPLTDSFCGHKAYRVKALERLTLTETGPGFPIEFWIQAWHAGLSVKEIPTPRIYIDAERRFGGQLDDAARRMTYYEQVLSRALSAVGASTLVGCSQSG